MHRCGDDCCSQQPPLLFPEIRGVSGLSRCKDREIFRLEEPQFPKWEIYCFLGYRTSWRVSEADEARACHKGEPQRLRLRVEEEARLGDQKGQGILEKEACCVLRGTALSPVSKCRHGAE